jgi:hypothetical protein
MVEPLLPVDDPLILAEAIEPAEATASVARPATMKNLPIMAISFSCSLLTFGA